VSDGNDMSGGGVRGAYDAIARHYDREIGDELAAKPLDRALLEALLELAGPGRVADVGCGPGHVTRWIAARHHDVVGVDLSPVMIDVARERAPELSFQVASMLDLPVGDGSWSGIVALYSIIHLTPDQLAAAFRELARTLRTGGWLLVAFHVDSAEFAAGDINHLTSWFGEEVDIDGYYLEPSTVVRDLEAADLVVTSTTIREAIPGAEYPSRRCYLLARRT
jgi:SAM-dependent methyltransferase